MDTAPDSAVRPSPTSSTKSALAGTGTEKTLALADATVTYAGPIAFYSWEQSVAFLDVAVWVTPAMPAIIVNGGVRLNRFASVFVTDSYPYSTNQWRVAVNNQSFSREYLSIYAVLLVGTLDSATDAGEGTPEVTSESAPVKDNLDPFKPSSTEEPATVLRLADATETSLGPVNVYSWDHKLKPGEHKAWVTDSLPDPVVAGGVHVHDWLLVPLTDSYPENANQWRLAAENFDSEALLTIYAITITGAKVDIYPGDSTIGSRQMKTWTLRAGSGTPVGGGIHVYGWNDVRLTNFAPFEKDKWVVGSENLQFSDVKVTLYILTLR
jgi:hypothetical protein